MRRETVSNNATTSFCRPSILQTTTNCHNHTTLNVYIFYYHLLAHGKKRKSERSRVSSIFRIAPSTHPLIIFINIIPDEILMWFIGHGGQ